MRARTRSVFLLLLAALAGCSENGSVVDGPVPPVVPPATADAVAPRVSLSTTAPMTLPGSEATFAASLIDDVGVTRATYEVNGGPEQPVTITPAAMVAFTTTLTIPTRDVRKVVVHGYDAAGNRGSSDTLRIFANVPPFDFVLSSPRAGQVYTTTPDVPAHVTNVTVTGDVPGGGFSHVGVSVNGGEEGRLLSGSRCNYTCFTTVMYGLKEGENVVDVTVYAGPPGSNVALGKKTVRFFWYRLPSIALTTPSAGEVAITTQPTIRVAGVAAHATGVARMTWQVNDGAEQPLAGSGTSVPFDFTAPIPVGASQVKVYAYLAAGPRNVTTVQVARTAAAGAPGAFTAVGTSRFSPNTCGIAAGKLYCWGRIGGYSSSAATIPTVPPGGGGISFTRVTAAHSWCALATGGEAYCRDAVTPGELGPVAGGLRFTTISLGRHVVCAVATDAAGYCWGEGRAGQLGNGSTADAPVPTRVSGGQRWSDISAGYEHACGITTEGVAYCWGANGYGEFGTGSYGNSTTPVAVSGGHTFASISAGLWSTCALDRQGAAFCWGVVARTGEASVLAPARLSGNLTFATVSVGADHACGVTTAGAAYCWGNNSNGQLGNGATLNSSDPTPVPVSGSLLFTSVSAGDRYTCGVARNGAAYCWGAGGDGQLGTGLTARSTVPVRVVDPG